MIYVGVGLKVKKTPYYVIMRRLSEGLHDCIFKKI